MALRKGLNTGLDTSRVGLEAAFRYVWLKRQLWAETNSANTEGSPAPSSGDWLNPRYIDRKSLGLRTFPTRSTQVPPDCADQRS